MNNDRYSMVYDIISCTLMSRHNSIMEIIIELYNTGFIQMESVEEFAKYLKGLCNSINTSNEDKITALLFNIPYSDLSQTLHMMRGLDISSETYDKILKTVGLLSIPSYHYEYIRFILNSQHIFDRSYIMEGFRALYRLNHDGNNMIIGVFNSLSEIERETHLIEYCNKINDMSLSDDMMKNILRFVNKYDYGLVYKYIYFRDDIIIDGLKEEYSIHLDLTSKIKRWFMK